ncbi:MAG: hypothetical protein N2593_01130 [Patescibacteria group bacterium]|nr:hypothetical protein [Patescibacteria group bacterium]
MNKKEVLYITIGIFLTIIAWIVADIYYINNRKKSKIEIDIPKIENYKINKEVLRIIENKK